MTMRMADVSMPMQSQQKALISMAWTMMNKSAPMAQQMMANGIQKVRTDIPKTFHFVLEKKKLVRKKKE